MTELLLALALTQPPFPGYPPPGPGYPPYPPLPTAPAPLPGPQPEGYDPLHPIGVETFAKSFRPTPGIHNVWFLHPKTKCAVLRDVRAARGVRLPESEVRQALREVRLQGPPGRGSVF